MTQQILANHPEVHTTAEPWILLHPLYQLHGDRIAAPYRAAQAEHAVRTFLAGLDDGDAAFDAALRSYAAELYGRALAGTGRSIFLDKTPRYYFVIEDLARVFPEAKFVILLRNPVAVLISSYRTWIQPSGNWLRMRLLYHDLFTAPRKLVNGIDLLGSRAVVVRYEDFLDDPAATTEWLFGELGLAYVPGMETYRPAAFEMGDRGLARTYAGPKRRDPDGWVRFLDQPQGWRLVADYVRSLGPETISALGYDPESIGAFLDQARPSIVRRAATFPILPLLRAMHRLPGWATGVRKRWSTERLRGIAYGLGMRSMPK